MTATDDERTVHRLEAFSDIVIGFSLAQLGVSLLRTTQHGTAIDLNGIISFLAAFAIICSLWFFHHRLFAKLFTPKTVPMLLNFAWLAVVVMLVVVAQKVTGNWTDARVDELYFGLYALAYGILALQAAIGLRLQEDLRPDYRAAGRRQIAFMSLWTLVFAFCFCIVTFLPPIATTGNLISLMFIIGAAGTAVLGRAFKARAKRIAA